MNPPIQQVEEEVQSATYVMCHYIQNDNRKGKIQYNDTDAYAKCHYAECHN